VASTKANRAAAPRRLRRWGLAGGALVAVAVGLGTALNWPILSGDARLGAAYGAHIVCSCHFIEGRGLDDCRGDFEAGMGMVTVSADEQAKAITARVIPLASETATWRPGLGCQLGKWH